LPSSYVRLNAGSEAGGVGWSRHPSTWRDRSDDRPVSQSDRCGRKVHLSNAAKVRWCKSAAASTGERALSPRAAPTHTHEVPMSNSSNTARSRSRWRRLRALVRPS
jgi:hypothetical protein